MDAIDGEYDYVIIDCPPSLGTLTVCALAASRYVLIPCQMGYLSLEGIADLLDTIDLIRNNLGRRELEILGVLPTFFDARNKAINETVRGELYGYFKDKVLRTKIRVNVDLNNAQVHKKTIFDYAPKSSGAKDYMALAREVLGYEPTQ